ncbi:isoc1 [Symbiodinium microadriaticum]|nr:isoc1 [Symbiodinium microadriaticum]
MARLGRCLFWAAVCGLLARLLVADTEIADLGVEVVVDVPDGAGPETTTAGTSGSMGDNYEDNVYGDFDLDDTYPDNDDAEFMGVHINIFLLFSNLDFYYDVIIGVG